MELSKIVVENLGKVFLNLGQGILLGTFVSKLFQSEISLVQAIIGFMIGLYTVYIGILFISQSTNLE